MTQYSKRNTRNRARKNGHRVLKANQITKTIPLPLAIRKKIHYRAAHRRTPKPKRNPRSPRNANTEAPAPIRARKRRTNAKSRTKRTEAPDTATTTRTDIRRGTITTTDARRPRAGTAIGTRINIGRSRRSGRRRGRGGRGRAVTRRARGGRATGARTTATRGATTSARATTTGTIGMSGVGTPPGAARAAAARGAAGGDLHSRLYIILLFTYYLPNKLHILISKRIGPQFGSFFLCILNKFILLISSFV